MKRCPPNSGIFQVHALLSFLSYVPSIFVIRERELQNYRWLQAKYHRNSRPNICYSRNIYCRSVTLKPFQLQIKFPNAIQCAQNGTRKCAKLNKGCNNAYHSFGIFNGCLVSSQTNKLKLDGIRMPQIRSRDSWVQQLLEHQSLCY